MRRKTKKKLARTTETPCHELKGRARNRKTHSSVPPLSVTSNKRTAM